MRIIRAMSQIQRIRQEMFGLSQKDFAVLAGITQPTVSRWERGECAPTLKELSRIRDAARERGLDWDDRLFFESPREEAAE